ncbi:MAG TPA: cation:proton antiporter [Verrucomicrobiae bacterium]|nr:cation:proton antiporter [Verrucomicrobiae bacterium]
MDVLLANFQTPLARLLLQFIAIILATRALGAVFKRFGQPSVIGEIAAGILLGPSLLGWMWPGVSKILFPQDSLGTLQLFSQIGVCLFMFVVGLELDLTQVRQRLRMAAGVSSAGIVLPFALGTGAAFLLFENYAAPGATFPAFVLFMGIAMSITAFPVLARILKERNLTQTPLGVTAITCAAVGDAAAWAILAFVVAIAKATNLAATTFNLALVVIFVAVMLLFVRPLLTRNEANSGARFDSIAPALVLLTASALTTEVIGIHALFGAFLAGVVMPKQKEFHERLVVRLENFAGVFLLPLFFAFNGLRTNIGALNVGAGWLICLGIIALATLGKLGGTFLAARLAGVNCRDAFALGALMNTRGLVELIALNIGYDLGILSPRIFSMLVLMALATTFMTGPLLNLAKTKNLSSAETAEVVAPKCG